MATGRWKWQDPDLLKAMRYVGDPPADDTVEKIYHDPKGDPEGVSKLLQSLIYNDQLQPEGLPQPVHEYVHATKGLPEWAEPELLERAEQLFVENGLTIYGLLGCASLPESYAILDATRVLGRTMNLQDPSLVSRRIMETSLFVLDVMSPGGLSEGGRGIRTAQKVRLMHASMRHLLRHTAPMVSLVPPAEAATPKARALAKALYDYQWNDKDFGWPIHQVAMTSAIISFSYIVLRGLHAFGVGLTEDDRHAYLHCWNVVGHVMGVREELLLSRPETMEEASAQYEMIWDANKTPSVDGPLLAKALLQYLDDCTDTRWMHRFPRILTYHLLGHATARLLGIKLDATDVGLRPLVVGTLWLLNRLPSLPRFPVLAKAKTKLFRDLFEDQLSRERGGNRPRYELHPTLKEAWRAKGLVV